MKQLRYTIKSQIDMKEIDNRFYNDIRTILKQARNKAYSAVNYAMVEAYWSIGKRIVDEEQKGKERADYGANLIKNLSIALNAEFGKGFSILNFCDFYSYDFGLLLWTDSNLKV